MNLRINILFFFIFIALTIWLLLIAYVWKKHAGDSSHLRVAKRAPLSQPISTDKANQDVTLAISPHSGNAQQGAASIQIVKNSIPEMMEKEQVLSSLHRRDINFIGAKRTIALINYVSYMHRMTQFGNITMRSMASNAFHPPSLLIDQQLPESPFGRGLAAAAALPSSVHSSHTSNSYLGGFEQRKQTLEKDGTGSENGRPAVVLSLRGDSSFSDSSFAPNPRNGALAHSDTADLLLSQKSPHIQDHLLKLSDNNSATKLLLDTSFHRCGVTYPHLQGFQNLSYEQMNLTSRMDEGEVRQAYSRVNSGGWWKPPDCIAWHKVAIVVPFRWRQYNLDVLLSYLHPRFQREFLHYRIFVVEQFGNETFNKGRLMNIGFSYAAKHFDFHCVIFHDVDLISEDDRNVHTCASHPKHMSVLLDDYGYKLPYEELVGGVFVVPKRVFILVNGYSNAYWGWGGEDDDMSYRMRRLGLRLTRPPFSVTYYRALPHKKWAHSSEKIKYRLLVTSIRRMRFDGLNTLEYRLMQVEERPLYTYVLADVGKAPEKI